MNRTSLTCLVAAAIAVSSAFAQNTTSPTNSGGVPPASAAQSPDATPSPSAMHSRAQSPQSHTEQSTKRAQTQARSFQSPSPQQSATEIRPSASYPHPSGQDSQPDHAPRTTKLAAVGSKTDRESGKDQSAAATDNSQQVNRLARKKSYSGRSGPKSDPGTACSTARPTSDGGVDCGMSGNSATNGHIVTKPH